MSSGAKTGKPGRGNDDFDLATYAPVAERISLFYHEFPSGRIVTELVSRTERDVVFKAVVYRDPGDREPAATGWAAEREGNGDVNSVACLENTETSAIGRALANLGFTASRQRPSAEEMAKASRERVRRIIARAKLAAGSHEQSTASKGISIDEVERGADDIIDVLSLIRIAERLGLRAQRASRIRAQLLTSALAEGASKMWTPLLKSWIAKRRADMVHGESP